MFLEHRSIAVGLSTFVVEFVSTILMAYQCLKSTVMPASGEERSKGQDKFRLGQVFEMPKSIIYRAILQDGVGYCVYVSS